MVALCRGDWKLAPLLVIAAFAIASCPCAASPADTGSACADVTAGQAKVNDYRSKDSTEFLKWSIEDNYKYHTGPAIERMRAGEYSHTVMADLDFTLRGWPNHLVALRALIDYALAKGKSYEFQTPDCYFVRARNIFPNDTAVINLEGMLYWKKKEFDRARDTYLAALKVDSESLDTHYNLGLVYFELKDYKSALDHARKAYDAGYPLPGLKNKLDQRGLWAVPKEAVLEIKQH